MAWLYHMQMQEILLDKCLPCELIRMQENPAAKQESSARIAAGMKNQAGIGEGITQGCSSLTCVFAL